MATYYLHTNNTSTKITVGPEPRGDLGSWDTFISVNAICEALPPKYSQYWFPWSDVYRPPPPEVWYGALKTLHREQTFGRDIYLYCDTGEYRSPAVLGAYLSVYFTPYKVKSIVEAAEGEGPNPLKCWSRYCAECPGLLEWVAGIPGYPYPPMTQCKKS